MKPPASLKRWNSRSSRPPRHLEHDDLNKHIAATRHALRQEQRHQSQLVVNHKFQMKSRQHKGNDSP